ncbi:MAG: hypothetical protein H0U57_01045 [Tatlockia sp.]|nr:hypothetical protein [Tatlockia sp.]
MKIHSLIKRYLDTYSKIAQHPFNQSLHKGDLAKSVFINFLEQDSLYLRDFYQAIKLVAPRLTNPIHRQHFESFAKSTYLFEREIQQKYLNVLPSATFFSEKRKPLQKISVIREYSEHLLILAKEAPIEEAVVSFVPCFSVYKELGEQMSLAAINIEHPYREWIASYADEQFKDSTELIIKIADELLQDIVCLEKEEKIAGNFFRSLDCEYRFFDDILFPKKANTDSLTFC